MSNTEIVLYLIIDFEGISTADKIPLSITEFSFAKYSWLVLNGKISV